MNFQDTMDIFKNKGMLPINNTQTTFNDTISEKIAKHDKIFGEWAYHTKLLQLKALDIVTAEEMRSLIKQLNSVDPEAVILAQETINNLIKEL